MSIRHPLFFFFLVFLSNNIQGQERVYSPFKLMNRGNVETSDTLTHARVYRVSHFYIIMYWDPTAPWYDSQKIAVQTPERETIFMTSSSGVDFMSPIAFRTSNPRDPIVLLIGEETNETNLGYNLFIVTGDSFRAAGKIDVAVFEESGYHQSIAPHLRMITNGTGITFRFDLTEKIVFQPGSNEEEIHDPEDILYMYREELELMRLNSRR